ncbi:hypothetical protein AMTRI_Chr08g159310 [Amborella trichopoda]
MGLRVNLEKTKMTRICLDQARVKCFTDSWGCAVEPMPASYLSLPFCIGLPRIQLWSLVIDKVEVILIKATISSISLFFISFFFMPTVTVARLKKLMRALRLLNALKGQVKEVKPQA